MNYKKRAAAVLMALLVVASVLPTVFAAENDAEGTITVALETDDSSASGGTEGGSDQIVTPGAPEISDSPVTPPSATTPPATEPPTTDPPATEPPATTPPATKPATTYQSNYASWQVDTTELTRQVAIASGLNEQDYTKESWAVLQEALEEGKKALSSYNQNRVDNAAKALDDAVSALVKMDYSDLWAILRKVEALNEPDEVYDLWSELVAAVESGRDLLSSGDQAAVDSGAEEISKILEKVKAYLEEINKPQIVTKEVKVEVPPSGEYCNIATHHVWFVLFVISAVLNVALVVLIVSILRKKQKQTDDTPLIDYDIDDDGYDV